MLYSATHPRRARTEVFWRDTAPIEHSVQIYADSSLFLDALEGFVSAGLRAGESVIVIATEAHRSALERRLRVRGYDVAQAQAEDRYIAVDAAATLDQFMAAGEPDEARFRQVVGGLITRARGQGRRVRAFGEMVALLWREGQHRATTRLEALWHVVCQQEALSLFCAYPRSVFSEDASEAIAGICAQHSRVIPD